MADARREVEYDVAIAVVLFFGESWNGSFKPLNSNPYRYTAFDKIKTEEEQKEEVKEGFATLRMGLKWIAQHKKN